MIVFRRAVFIFSTMENEEKKAAELNELNRMIERGLTFTVKRKKKVRRPGWLGWIRKKITIDEDVRFEIKEPTLSVLDRISAEGIMMDIDESQMQSDAGMSIAKKMVHDHARRMARVIAIAVLGENYEIATINNGRTSYIRDDRRLDELTDLFAHSVKPSDLINLCVAINTMSNLGDFTNCIRLTSANRTTIPDRVQK